MYIKRFRISSLYQVQLFLRNIMSTTHTSSSDDFYSLFLSYLGSINEKQQQSCHTSRLLGLVLERLVFSFPFFSRQLLP